MEQALERADAVIVERHDRVKHLRQTAEWSVGLRRLDRFDLSTCHIKIVPTELLLAWNQTSACRRMFRQPARE